MRDLAAGAVGAAIGFPLGFRAKPIILILAVMALQLWLGSMIYSEGRSSVRGVKAACGGLMLLAYGLAGIAMIVQALRRRPFPRATVRLAFAAGSMLLILFFYVDIAGSQLVNLITSGVVFYLLALILPPVLMAVMLWMPDPPSVAPPDMSTLDD